MRLVGYPFQSTFAFHRAVAAPVRNDAGAIVEAAIDAPRFDRDVDGRKLGLLVSPGLTLGQADRCAVVAGDWEVEGAATVLHEYADATGVIARRAFYTNDCRATVNAVLRNDAHHRIIGAVSGQLKNRSGVVRYRERLWALAGDLGTGVDGQVLGDGSVGDRKLVEG